MGTAASHLFPLHVFRRVSRLVLLKKALGGQGAQDTADPESVNVERIKVSVCSSHILCSAAFCSYRDVELQN